MWMRWHWIIWFLELDTCKSQKQQSNFAWFCLVLQITHQFEKEVTKQSVIDCSWNDLDFYWLLSAVHKLLPWNLKGYNLKWLRTLSFETSYWTFFFVLHWLFSRRRNKAYKCPRIVWRTDYSCSIGTCGLQMPQEDKTFTERQARDCTGSFTSLCQHEWGIRTAVESEGT